jgi:hypothetical protein
MMQVYKKNEPATAMYLVLSGFESWSRRHCHRRWTSQPDSDEYRGGMTKNDEDTAARTTAARWQP